MSIECSVIISHALSGFSGTDRQSLGSSPLHLLLRPLLRLLDPATCRRLLQSTCPFFRPRAPVYSINGAQRQVSSGTCACLNPCRQKRLITFQLHRVPSDQPQATVPSTRWPRPDFRQRCASGRWRHRSAKSATCSREGVFAVKHQTAEG